RDLGVAQHRQRNVAVVVGSLGIVEDRGDLPQMLLAQQERAVAKRLVRKVRERLRIDLYDLLAVERGRRDELVREQAVLGLVLGVRKKFLVGELRRVRRFRRLGHLHGACDSTGRGKWRLRGKPMQSPDLRALERRGSIRRTPTSRAETSGSERPPTTPCSRRNSASRCRAPRRST